MGCRLSFKIHFSHSLLNLFQANLSFIGDEQVVISKTMGPAIGELLLIPNERKQEKSLFAKKAP